jgi:hypothetical protein
LPDTDGVLVALAEAQMRQKLAEIEAGRLASLPALGRTGRDGTGRRSRAMSSNNSATMSNIASGRRASVPPLTRPSRSCRRRGRKPV